MAAALATALAGCDPATMTMGPSMSRAPQVGADQAYIDARTVLLQAVSDPDPMTRAHAYEGISQTLGTRDAGILMQGLDDEAVVVRFAATMALAELSYAPAKSRLLAIVQDRNADQRVVCAAIFGLHNLGDDRYAGQLAVLLTSDFPPGRATAAQVMGLMKEPSAAGPLRTALGDEKDPSVRISIDEALARLGDRRSAQALEAYARGYFLDMRLAAIPVLAEVRAPHAERLLKRMFAASDGPPRVRVAAAGGLADMGMGDRALYEYCVECLSDPQKAYQDAYGQDQAIKSLQINSLRRLAAMSLGKLKWRESLDVLHEQLSAADGGTRVASAMAILRILGRKWTPAPAETPAEGSGEKASPVRRKTRMKRASAMEVD